MRREFILVLLGIICISTLSSLLSGYVQIETDKILLDTVVGAVGAGNFSYWQLGHTGPLLVELTSLSGDADLYVSDTVRTSLQIPEVHKKCRWMRDAQDQLLWRHLGEAYGKHWTSFGCYHDDVLNNIFRPSYETDKNNFSSVTCGPDMVNIPSEFPRPIGIGVFGHWSHYLSEYSIQVFLDASAVLSEEQVLAIERAHRGIGEKYGEIEKRKEKPAARKADEEPKPRFLRLLSILDMIFEMFVL